MLKFHTPKILIYSADPKFRSIMIIFSLVLSARPSVFTFQNITK